MLSYFCGVEALATSIGLLLSQQKYAIDLLTKHNMLGSKPVSTPFVVGTSMTANDGTTPINATMYRHVVGGRQHLRMTRSDISFAMKKLSQFQHAPSKHHWGAIKHLLHYFNGTRSLGIHPFSNTPQTLYGFSDVDWAGIPDDRTSTGAFLIFLCANPIFWSSTKQRIVARSSIKVEYRAIATAITKLQ